MKKLLVIDNYDSFTYNLVHAVEKYCDAPLDVVRNDKINLVQINDYSHIILSPGPGLPEDAKLLIPLIRQYAGKKKILGVCLGHQAIALAFGGNLVNLKKVYHGITGSVQYKGSPDLIFRDIPNGFLAGRYHSWSVDPENLPACLKMTACDENGHIMGLRHQQYDIQGLQFHPESIMTEYGERIMENWLSD